MRKTTPSGFDLWTKRIHGSFLYIVLLVLLGVLVFGKEGTAVAVGIAACIVFIAIGTENISKFTLGAKGIEFERVASRVATNSEIIEKFVFMSMPKATFDNLEKVTSNQFGDFRMTDRFREQIRYLRENGFVTVTGYVGQIPEVGNELSMYVHPTETGLEFVRIRRELIEKTTSAVLSTKPVGGSDARL